VNIYLDIDGVILANDQQAALYADEFIAQLVNAYDVNWLTTHCRNPGDDPVPMLENYFKTDTVKYLKQIKPTYWDVLKTEAIDFSHSFRWFDDQLFDAEKDKLMDKGLIESWVEIDLRDNPEALRDYLDSQDVGDTNSRKHQKQ
jgi:DNA polymerase III epsilon subunit-like protein